MTIVNKEEFRNVCKNTIEKINELGAEDFEFVGEGIFDFYEMDIPETD